MALDLVLHGPWDATSASLSCFLPPTTTHRAWWGEQDSNLRSQWQRIYSPSPLTAWVSPRLFLRERASSGRTRAPHPPPPGTSQIRPRRGASGGSRTRNRPLTKRVLCQLSYASEARRLRIVHRFQAPSGRASGLLLSSTPRAKRGSVAERRLLSTLGRRLLTARSDRPVRTRPTRLRIRQAAPSVPLQGEHRHATSDRRCRAACEQ